jgi:hypothetical protein
MCVEIDREHAAAGSRGQHATHGGAAQPTGGAAVEDTFHAVDSRVATHPVDKGHRRPEEAESDPMKAKRTPVDRLMNPFMPGAGEQIH